MISILFSRRPITVNQYTNWYTIGSVLIQHCCLNTSIEISSIDAIKDFQDKCEEIRRFVGSGGNCPVTLIDSSPAMIYIADHWDREPANKGIKQN